MAMMVTPIAWPSGDGGVSTISRAAGRNASSSWPRDTFLVGTPLIGTPVVGTTALAELIGTCL